MLSQAILCHVMHIDQNKFVLRLWMSNIKQKT